MELDKRARELCFFMTQDSDIEWKCYIDLAKYVNSEILKELKAIRDTYNDTNLDADVLIIQRIAQLEAQLEKEGEDGKA